jgi:hypothetical protein
LFLRAYGWFAHLRAAASNLSSLAFEAKNLGLNYEVAGTRHGLSKWPYLRDSRRAVGVGGYKLLHTQLRDSQWCGKAACRTGDPFPDAVALGDYNDDTHHLAASVCTYPKYVVECQC